MLFSVKEMEVLCVIHAGTRSKTLALLRDAKNMPTDTEALIQSVIEKLSNMKDEDVASIAFELEN